MKTQRSEFVRFLKFVLVGMALSLIHLFISWVLISWHGMNLMPANMIAFLVSNVISFFANSIWTFDSGITMGAYVRFSLVSLSGIGVVALGALISESAGVGDFFGTVLIVCMLPVISFLAHRKWTFK